MTHGSLFSGIGGFDLAARIVGWDNAFSCEIDPFCNRVLKYHFPNETHHEDIRETDFSVWRGRIDVLSGGFPCQPFSQAGKRKGTDDDRHLWPAMLTAIRAIRPRWVVGENVLGIVNWSDGLVFEQVCAELEAEGYQVQPFVLPACGVDAPHRRYRTFFIAHRNDDQCESGVEFDKQCRGSATAQSGDATENADGHGRNYIEWKKEPGQWQQRDVSSGNNERLCVQARDIADADNTGGGTPECGNISDRTADSQQRQHPFSRTGGHGEITADTAINGYQSHGENQEVEGERWPDDGQSEERGTTPERSDGLSDVQRLLADTDHKGLEGTAVMRIQGDERRRYEFWNEEPAGDCGQGFWDDFPTQPPVCRRDDGLSMWLDPAAVFAGVTPSKRAVPFNRWRTESVKAYGNAVVVPLIVQVFRAIDRYMKLYP